jgi:hypothetical protein
MPAAFCGGVGNGHRDHSRYISDPGRQHDFAVGRATTRRTLLRVKPRSLLAAQQAHRTTARGRAPFRRRHASRTSPNRTASSDKIAARQLHALHQRLREKKLRLSEVTQMFMQMKDAAGISVLTAIDSSEVALPRLNRRADDGRSHKGSRLFSLWRD